MPNFVLTYHGDVNGMPRDPAEIAKVMDLWGAWYGSMGDALIDGGAPIAGSTAIGPDGNATDAPASLSGYTVIKADDVAAATTIAQGCPVLANGHTVQISEAMDM